MKHIVMFSGGVGSWAAAKRVAAKHGTGNMLLLFADTRMEDEDLYRFIMEAAVNVGAPLVYLADGRTPWQVFHDVRMLGNSQKDPCSKILKRQLMWRWVKQNCNPKDTIIHFGISWDEEHRMIRVRRGHRGWQCSAPMCDSPYYSKIGMLNALQSEGITPPRLYKLGFPHNNCGGFCIKAGQAQFATLLREMPERYRFHEEEELNIQRHLGKAHTILKDRRGKATRPLSLRDFRLRLECNGADYDQFEWGGCGCALG